MNWPVEQKEDGEGSLKTDARHICPRHTSCWLSANVEDFAMLLSTDQYAELQTLVFYFNASVYFTNVNAHYFYLMVESLNSSTSLHCSSTSLCYIALFSGCWNIAYGGDPLYGGGVDCFCHCRGCFLALLHHFLAECIFCRYISPSWRKKTPVYVRWPPPTR